ncbi:ABC transporter permease subunit [Blastococcus saxobsidens]|uniref:ABC transporter permease subunit n=1 Tax=Blastococcus saxobsidens TaxID=138336 RepID=A0A6L9VYL4_9ACTN|nr:ABC transporter permease subunit [Blastococcus saxobsidens]NEK84778.1 ABC transporter permease subunit [Blastococcus saxobsidens]
MTTTLTLTAPRSDVPVRRTAPSLPTLVGLEMRKSLSHRSGKAFATAAVLMGPVGLALAALDAEFGWVAGPMGVVAMMTGLVMLALGVVSTAGEWTHGTVQTTYLLVPQRGRVLTAKAGAVALLGAAFAAVAAAASIGVIALVGVDDLNWTGWQQSVVATVAAGAVFAVIGAGIGAATANTTAALTTLYLLVLGVLPLVRVGKPELGDAVDPAHAAMLLSQGSEETRSILILTGWVVVASVAGWVLAHRRPVQ